MKKWIDAFIRRVDREALPVEAVMAYQDDKPVAEHHWVPDVPRNIYSHTKSYMSTAVGMAIADGLLSLSDKPAEFFPEALPENAPAALEKITLRDVLMMASGFDDSLLMASDRTQGIGAPDYLKYVFAHSVKQPPGVKFHYSNGDSYLAGRMLEARVGKTIRDYLNERLFIPLQIPYPEWEHCPQGHTFGASGLQLRIVDMMKLGRLYLLDGRWNGEQLVSPEWVQQASALQIGTPEIEGNPWHMGYGYQFWRSPYPDAYRADGAYGQITSVLPHAQAVVSIQCTESEQFDSIRTALHEEVLTRL